MHDSFVAQVLTHCTTTTARARAWRARSDRSSGGADRSAGGRGGSPSASGGLLCARGSRVEARASIEIEADCPAALSHDSARPRATAAAAATRRPGLTPQHGATCGAERSRPAGRLTWNRLRPSPPEACRDVWPGRAGLVSPAPSGAPATISVLVTTPSDGDARRRNKGRAPASAEAPSAEEAEKRTGHSPPRQRVAPPLPATRRLPVRRDQLRVRFTRKHRRAPLLVCSFPPSACAYPKTIPLVLSNAPPGTPSLDAQAWRPCRP